MLLNARCLPGQTAMQDKQLLAMVHQLQSMLMHHSATTQPQQLPVGRVHDWPAEHWVH